MVPHFCPKETFSKKTKRKALSQYARKKADRNSDDLDDFRSFLGGWNPLPVWLSSDLTRIRPRALELWSVFSGRLRCAREISAIDIAKQEVSR